MFHQKFFRFLQKVFLIHEYHKICSLIHPFQPAVGTVVDTIHCRCAVIKPALIEALTDRSPRIDHSSMPDCQNQIPGRILLQIALTGPVEQLAIAGDPDDRGVRKTVPDPFSHRIPERFFLYIKMRKWLIAFHSVPGLSGPAFLSHGL